MSDSSQSAQDDMVTQLPPLPPLPTTPGIADPVATQSGQTQNQAAQPAADANPLEALEQILKDARAKAESQQPEAGAAVPPKPPGPMTAEEAQTKQAVLDAKAEENEIRDQAAISQQLADLQSVVNTPAYQARVEQDSAKKQADELKQDQADKFAIHQLGHTKI